MKKRIGALLLAVSMVISTAALGGCSTGQEAGVKTAVSAANGKSAADYKIVLILPGPINDQSWNATNYAGLQACNETLGTKMEYVENVQASDYESTFREYAERGYNYH